MLSGYLREAYVEWLGSAVSCCTPLGHSDDEDKNLGGNEKPMTILHDQQPHLVPPPMPESQYRHSARVSSRPSANDLLARSREFATRASSRGSFSVRRTLNAYNGPRKPPIKISAPTNFRHVQNALSRRDEQNASPGAREQNAIVSRPHFRPLELSIYMPENRLSDLLPYFDTADNSDHVDKEVDTEMNLMEVPKSALVHSRSSSSISTFLVARKPVHSRDQSTTIGRSSVDTRYTTAPSMVDTPWTSFTPSIKNSTDLDQELPILPAAARLRSGSDSSVPLVRAAEQYGRVKSVLQEREELERRLQNIETIIEERKSIYSKHMSSLRPKTPASPRLPDQVMINATTSTHSARPHLDRSFYDPATAFTSHPPTPPERRTYRLPVTSTPPPPPPLPMILQPTTPTLRKKKSFSRISTWLSRTQSSSQLTILTNTPRPVTSKEGFYQCVDVFSPSLPSARIEDMSGRRASVDTVSAISYKSVEAAELTTGTTGSSPNSDSEKFSTFGRKRGGDLRDRFLALEREKVLEAARDAYTEVDDTASDVGDVSFDDFDQCMHAVSVDTFANATTFVKQRPVIGVAS